MRGFTLCVSSDTLNFVCNIHFIFYFRMEYESSQSEDDISYVPEVTDSDFSDASEDNMGAQTVDGWTSVISLIFILPFSFLMQNLWLTISKFSLKKIILYLCQWTNKRAAKYFEDISYKPIKVYRLK